MTIDGQLEVEAAYMINNAFWRQGLATEATQGILRYGFDQLKLSRLICLMYPVNIASQRVVKKMGVSLKKVDGIAGDNFPILIYAVNKS